MDHIKALQRMRNEGWSGSPEAAALDAAIAVLSAPQPSAEAQPVMAYVEHHADKVSSLVLTCEAVGLGLGKHALYAAPPSAPVGVAADILRIVDTAIDVCNDRDRPAMAEDLEAVRLYVEQASAPLAQQPAAVDEAMVERINQRFTSGNSIPVERAHLTAEEWRALTAALAAQQGGEP